jgi:GNAT superfamily N-acetyltransferase
MSQLQARLAKPSDYPSLVRLCRRAVGPDDYVLHYLRDVIRERGLFLAFHDQEPVGMTTFERCIDGSGWLGMARTDPASRRQGVAIFLQKIIAKHARKGGIKILRLWTLSTNRPAIRACIKGGYKPVCRAVHVSQRQRRRKTLRRFSPNMRISTRLADSILRSRYISRMNGYMPYKWHIIEPDLNVLRRAAKSRKFYNIGETAFLLSIPDFAAWDTKRQTMHSEFTLLDGPAEDSFNMVKEAAQSIRVGYLGGYLPLDRRLLEKAREAGFWKDSWADYCIVFEKQLR